MSENYGLDSLPNPDPDKQQCWTTRQIVAAAGGLGLTFALIVGGAKVEHELTHTDTAVSVAQGDTLRQLANDRATEAVAAALQGVDEGQLEYKPDIADSYVPTGFDIVSIYGDRQKVVDIKRSTSQSDGLTRVMVRNELVDVNYYFSGVRRAVVPAEVTKGLSTWVFEKAEVDANNIKASIELERTDDGYVVTTSDSFGVPDNANDAVDYATAVIYGELPPAR